MSRIWLTDDPSSFPSGRPEPKEFASAGPAVRSAKAVTRPSASKAARMRATCAGRYQPCAVSSSRVQKNLTGLRTAIAVRTAPGTPSGPRRRPKPPPSIVVWMRTFPTGRPAVSAATLR